MKNDLKNKISLTATANLNSQIGKRIQQLRKKQFITQEQLAEALDVSIKHISAVERGLSTFSLERLVDVSFILNCSIEYLIMGKESRVVSSKLPSFVIEILEREESEEFELFIEYLYMYQSLRGFNL